MPKQSTKLDWLDAEGDLRTPGGQFTRWLSDRSQVLCSRWIVARTTLEDPARIQGQDLRARDSLSATYAECSAHGALTSIVMLSLGERLASAFAAGLAMWCFERVKTEGVFTAPTAWP